MRGNDVAGRIQQKTRGHCLHVHVRSKGGRRVETDGEVMRKPGEEPIGILPLMIEIYRHNNKSLRSVSLLHALHPGKRLPARTAPRRPEIEPHDMSAIFSKLGYCGV